MSRYEQKESKRYISVFLVVAIVCLALFFIGSDDKKQESLDTEITSLEIPIEKLPAKMENKIPLTGVLETESAKSNQKTEFVEIPMVKPILADLEHSDIDFKVRLDDVSKSLTDWFTIQQSIRKYIVLINDLSQNQIIFKHSKFLKMPEKMLVKEDSKGLYLAKESYRRFDALANAIDAIDVAKGEELFLLYKPFFNQVFEGFAYPAEYNLEDIFLKAAASVIDAPVIETRLALVQDSVRYKYSDKKLESLNAVKKQMLRMGPENTKKIQAKLRELIEVISVYSE